MLFRNYKSYRSTTKIWRREKQNYIPYVKGISPEECGLSFTITSSICLHKFSSKTRQDAYLCFLILDQFLKY